MSKIKLLFTCPHLIFVILAFILLMTSSLFSSGLLFPIIKAASAQSATTVQPYEITTRGNLPYPTVVQV
jgi:hypothetical protein